MNAIAKGVSLGIYGKSKGKGIDVGDRDAQPYVDLMGRRIPLYQTAAGTWRALSSATPASPGAAYSYISRTLRQTAPAVVGAMRLLAESFADPAELNGLGWALYADFRPEVDGWGKRGEVRCVTILSLRKKRPAEVADADGGRRESQLQDVVKYEAVSKSITSDASHPQGEESEPPDTSSQKVLAAEDDAAFDEDALFMEFNAEDLAALP